MRAPNHLTVCIWDGLIDGRMSLGMPLIVPVAPGRRDECGWPALIFGALVIGQEAPHGVPAVWATSEYGSPALAVDGAAREFSMWPSIGSGDPDIKDAAETLARFPEVAEASRCLAALRDKDIPEGR